MESILIVFLIAALGYLIGSIKIAGLKLGNSAVLLVALVFGHFGMVVSSDLKNFGLMLFVCAVGFIAGPVFFDNFKKRAFAYIVLGIIIVVTGAVSAAVIIILFRIPTSLTLGLLAGALTSTPGLAVAGEVTQDSMAVVGYGIAYPFGVVGVVLFCQLIPKILKADIAEEAAKLQVSAAEEHDGKKYKLIEESGFLIFCFAMVVGLLIAEIKIPLPGGMTFSLGTSGGPLIAGLFFGRFHKVKSYSFPVPEHTLDGFRELGLVLFLMGAGTSAGQGFVEVLKEYGAFMFVLGAVITLLPMLIGYFMARRVFKIEMFNALGSICGGMTSTPALGTLIDVAGTNNVAAAYAATYPVALITIVFVMQAIAIIF